MERKVPYFLLLMVAVWLVAGCGKKSDAGAGGRTTPMEPLKTSAAQNQGKVLTTPPPP
jgi:hypothetical protein